MDFDLNYTFKAKDLDPFLKAGAFLSLPSGEYFLGLRPLGEISEPEGETLFYAQKFFGELDSPYVLYGQRAKLTRDQFKDALSQTSSKVTPALEWTEPDKKEFINTFELILNEMDKGKLKKAVPIVYEVSQSKMNTELKAQCILNLLNSDHGGFAYGFWNEDGGILGLTPELLFSNEGNKVLTAALASTSSDSSQLMTDQKLKTEHELVVDDIRARLEAIGKVEIAKTEPQKFGNLFHLKTPIQISKVKEDVFFEQVLKLLHPTAALGVFPREFDWQWLRNLGGLRRRRHYGAPIGLRDENGKGFAVVAIRNIQWDQEEVWISSGAGMIADSDADKEWEELKLKRELTKKVLGLSN